MSQPAQTPLNLLPIDVELADALAIWKKDIFLNFNCHHLATIQSFDSLTQTAKATINYKKTFYTNDGSGNNVPIQVAYPILADCPVITMAGGSTAITFPIAAGDECLVLFNDRDIDNWYLSGSNNTGILNTSRLHSFADGLILIGPRSLPNVVSNYSTTHAVIRNDAGAQVGVNGSAATALISNNSTTLGQQLQNLITAIQAITVTVDGTPTPINNIASFTSIASALVGLLE